MPLVTHRPIAKSKLVTETTSIEFTREAGESMKTYLEIVQIMIDHRINEGDRDITVHHFQN